jgi:Uma2 family endonuclease
MRTQLYLTPADHGRPLTYDEFLRAGAQEGYRYELIDGRLCVSPIPNMPHEVLCKWLERLLDRYAEAHPEVINFVSSPARIFVPGRADVTAPEPDLAAYRDFPREVPLARLRWQDFSPVLVIEILSEDNEEKDWERNLELYLQVPSIREYWVLDPLADPDRPSLTVYRRRGARWQKPIRVAAGGRYTTPLLPDFTLVLDPHA